MKRRLLFLFTLISCLIFTVIICEGAALETPPHIEWQRAFGGTYESDLRSLVGTSDGSFLGVGVTNCADGDIKTKEKRAEESASSILIFLEDEDLLVVKFDSSGKEEWHNTYGGTSDDSGFVAAENNDGTYTVFGLTSSKDGDLDKNQHGNRSLWMLKLSKTGDVLKNKVISDITMSINNISALQVLENGYILAIEGSDGSFKTSCGVRLDFEGNIIWQKPLTGLRMHDLTMLKDGNLIGAGSQVVCFSTDGEILWQMTAGQQEQGIYGTEDGGFVWAMSINAYHEDIISRHNTKALRPFPKELYEIGINTSTVILVAKYDKNRQVEWANYLGGTLDDTVTGIKETKEGDFVVLATTKSNDRDVSDNRGSNDFWLAKLSKEGELIWGRTIGGSDEDSSKSLVLKNDGYILGGNTLSNDEDVKGKHNPGSKYRDWWLVKLGYDSGSIDPGNAPSDWAKADVEEAKSFGLVPAALRDDYKSEISREEFCELIVTLYDILTEGRMSINMKSNPFTDTDNPNVIKAYSLGVVSGIGEGLFKPKDTLTREQAAVILYNLIGKIKTGLDVDVKITHRFGDNASISNWANEALYYLNYRGMMKGTDKNEANPKGKLTKEQGIILAKMLYEKIDDYHIDEFFIVQKSPVTINVGERITIDVIVKGSDLAYYEKNPTWQIFGAGVIDIGGNVLSGYRSSTLGEPGTKAIITGDNKVIVTGEGRGRTNLTVTIGQRENLQSQTIEIIVK